MGVIRNSRNSDTFESRLKKYLKAMKKYDIFISEYKLNEELKLQFEDYRVFVLYKDKQIIQFDHNILINNARSVLTIITLGVVDAPARFLTKDKNINNKNMTKYISRVLKSEFSTKRFEVLLNNKSAERWNNDINLISSNNDRKKFIEYILNLEYELSFGYTLWNASGTDKSFNKFLVLSKASSYYNNIEEFKSFKETFLKNEIEIYEFLEVFSKEVLKNKTKLLSKDKVQDIESKEFCKDTLILCMEEYKKNKELQQLSNLTSLID